MISQKPILSIIILNYNQPEILRKCLESLKKAKITIDYQIIVVDNGSSLYCRKFLKSLIKENELPASKLHGTPVLHRESSLSSYFISGVTPEFRRGDNKNNIELIQNKENLGFAAGNNIGIGKAKGDYILLLNSDTIISSGAIEKVVFFMENNNQAGAATCKVLLENGKIDPACHRGFPTPWAALTYFCGLEKIFPKSKIFGQYHLGFLPFEKIHEIDSPTGAFFMIKKEVIQQVGLLDENYFMYGEDLDWSFRIKEAGFKIFYLPEANIVHLKKRSGRLSGDKDHKNKINYYFYFTMKLFYKKHYLDKYPKILLYLILFLIDLKIFLITGGKKPLQIKEN